MGAAIQTAIDESGSKTNRLIETIQTKE
jgi:hypothetical protein